MFKSASEIKKKITSGWIRSNVDYSRERQDKLYTFQGDSSFFDCQLPPLGRLSQTVRSHYVRNVLDEELRTYLEKSHSLNRFSQTIQLHAVNVPKDGNCLLHAVSVAVWSVDDSRNTLRDLMFISVKEDLNLQKRWLSQEMRILQPSGNSASLLTSVKKTWDDLVDNISQHSAGTSLDDVPCRFSYPFYIYVLANILRRPIIVVVDSKEKSFTRNDPQSCDIGGVYLPLEWEPIECCKTPVIIGYSFQHFYPLISEVFLESPAQNPGKDSQFFPLVTNDWGLLLVRYLTGPEVATAWNLVQSYLVVKELTVLGDDRTVTTVPCAQITLKPLTPTNNFLFEHESLLKDTYVLNAPQRHFFLQLNENNDQRHVNDTSFQQRNPNGENDALKSVHTNLGGGDHFNFTSESKFNSSDNSPVTPTAPLLSLQPQSHVQLVSMITERCRNGCGYRCSTQTQPFCHECYSKEMQRNKEEGMCLLERLNVPAVGSNNVINVNSAATLHGIGNHARTPTAPPPSIGPQLLEQISILIEPRNYHDKESSNQTYTFFNKFHKTEVQNNPELEQNNNTRSVLHKSIETVGEESKVKDTINARPLEVEMIKSDVSAFKGRRLWPEKEKHLDSYMNNPSYYKSAGMSLCGSYIQQASDECNHFEWSPQHPDETKIEGDSYFVASKLSPKPWSGNLLETSKQSVQWPNNLSNSKQGVHASLSPTFTGEKLMYRDINQLNVSSYKEGNISARKSNSNVQLDRSLLADKAAALELGNPAMLKLHRGSRNYSNSSSLISTDDESNLSSGTESLNIDTQSSTYSGSFQSSLPPYSSTIFQTLGSPELTPTVVTSITSHNTSGSTRMLPTDYSYTFYQEPTEPMNYEGTEDNWKTSAEKCKFATCSNYGNRKNAGYCNACHKVIRRQQILAWEAQQGMDVPDCGRIDLSRLTCNMADTCKHM